MNKYVFKEYDPIYPELFQKEKQRLLAYLSEPAKIEHFGSTAVTGLGGKGIIDIYVVVSKDKLLKTSKEIEKAGYEFRPNGGTDKRLFFRKIAKNSKNNEQRYHVHLTSVENSEFHKDIAFRDHLRKSPTDLHIYSDIKKEAVKKANNDKDEYMRIKQPVIQKILKKMLENNS